MIKQAGGTEAVQLYGKPAYGRPGRAFLVANTDIINPVSYSDSASVTSLDSIIRPLGAVAFDGSGDVWASTLQPGTSVLLDCIPGGTSWAPSPADVALQIATLGLAKDATVAGVPGGIATSGVPLLSKAVSLLNGSGAVLTPGGTKNYATLAVSQIGYEIALSVLSGAAAIPFVQWTVQWIDSTTGLITSEEDYYTAGGSSSACTVVGTGPAKGDQLKISATNLDSSVNATVGCVVTQNSRVYIRDSWAQSAFPAVNGYVLPTSQIQAGLIFNVNVTISGGSNAPRLLPFYNGTIDGFAAAAPSDTALLTLQWPAGTIQAGVTSYCQVPVTSGAQQPFTASLPRGNIVALLANTGSSSGTFQAGASIRETQP